MYSAQGGNIEIFNKLLELGADPMAADEVTVISISCDSSQRVRVAVSLLLLTGLY